MEKFLDLAKSRHSVRNYQKKEVEAEKLNAILEAARIAPTAANQQPCRLLVVNNSESLGKLNRACSSHGAPLAIVVCADKNAAWVRPFDKAIMTEIDATIATDHMMMTAQDLGLSSCWITYFDPVIIRQQFNIPENLVPINVLAMGYGADSTSDPNRYQRDRNSLESIVTYDTF